MREFPTVQTIYLVTTILKSGNPSLVSNYMPLSILPHISNLFESIEHSCIKKSLNHIIIDEQHGFRPGKSTISYILENFKSGCKVNAVFTNFSIAFDTVDHNFVLFNQKDSVLKIHCFPSSSPISALECNMSKYMVLLSIYSLFSQESPKSSSQSTSIYYIYQFHHNLSI